MPDRSQYPFRSELWCIWTDSENIPSNAVIRSSLIMNFWYLLCIYIIYDYIHGGQNSEYARCGKMLIVHFCLFVLRFMRISDDKEKKKELKMFAIPGFYCFFFFVVFLNWGKKMCTFANDLLLYNPVNNFVYQQH